MCTVVEDGKKLEMLVIGRRGCIVICSANVIADQMCSLCTVDRRLTKFLPSESKSE